MIPSTRRAPRLGLKGSNARSTPLAAFRICAIVFRGPVRRGGRAAYFSSVTVVAVSAVTSTGPGAPWSVKRRSAFSMRIPPK